jgi:hypothetical protein
MKISKIENFKENKIRIQTSKKILLLNINKQEANFVQLSRF